MWVEALTGCEAACWLSMKLGVNSVYDVGGRPVIDTQGLSPCITPARAAKCWLPTDKGFYRGVWLRTVPGELCSIYDE